MAARRADASSSETGRDASETDDAQSATTGRPTKSLAPARPWQRTSDEPEDDTEPAPAEATADETAQTERRRGVLGPARPWAGRGPQPAPAAEQPAGRNEEEPEVSSSGGRLRPARPWRGRPAAAAGPAEAGETSPLVPSHPDVVLRGIAEAEDVTPEVEAPSRLRGLLHRGSGRRVEDDDAEPARRLEAERLAAQSKLREAERALVEQRAEAERALAEQRAEAERVRAEAERLRADREEAERLLAEERAEAERVEAERRAAITARHAARPAEPDDAGAESTAADDAAHEAAGAEPVLALSEAAGEPEAAQAAQPPAEVYPWQREEAVDLDLHGVPTWDPEIYPAEPETAEGRPTRRVLRWLLARAPEPEAAEPEAAEPLAPAPAAAATSELEPLAGLPVARLAVDDIVAREAPVEQPPAEPDSDTDVTAAVQDQQEEVAPSRRSRSARSTLGRLLGRGNRQVEEPEEQPEAQFELPAAHADFDEPWLTAPRPTRDWSQRAPLDALRAPGAQEEPTEVAPGPAAEPVESLAEPALEPDTFVEAAPEPEPEPVPQPEPVPEPEPEPEPQPVPTPEPPARPTPGPRPTPGSAAPRRPSPGRPTGTYAAEAAAAPAAKRRPGPGPAATGVAAQAQRPLPFELASAAPSATARPAPDLSRFLKATEEDEDEEKDGPGGSSRSRLRRFLTRWSIFFIIAALAAVLLRAFVVQPYYIPSESMEPTLHGCAGCNDDHVLVDKISYRIHDPHVGDIVVFHKPDNAQVSEDVLIKRIIAKAHDRIAIKKGQVFINGRPIEESYLNKDHTCYPTDPAENFAARTVPDGKVFVMGDNRCNSDDSREFGPISTSSIIGRAFAIVWPVHRMRFLGS